MSSYTISVGFGLGAVHALSGPDHLISLLPFIIGRRFYVAFLYGLVWGIGHALSTGAMGIAAYTLKYSILPSSSWLERIIDIVVGLTLVMIGILGLIEIKNSGDDEINVEKKDNNTISDNNNDSHNTISKTLLHFSGVLTNGIVLGLSWDALPSLTPAVSITKWTTLFIFILFYGIGTLVAISISSAIIGESTYFILNDILLVKSKLPMKLAYGSSIAALVFGMIWIFYAFLLYYKSSYLIANELNDGTTNNIILRNINLNILVGNNSYYISILGFALMILIVYKRKFIHKFYQKYHSG